MPRKRDPQQVLMMALVAPWQPPITPSDTQNHWQNNNQAASLEFTMSRWLRSRINGHATDSDSEGFPLGHFGNGRWILSRYYYIQLGFIRMDNTSDPGDARNTADSSDD
jgi:hypothetical protein